jgi:hypothetical protein
VLGKRKPLVKSLHNTFDAKDGIYGVANDSRAAPYISVSYDPMMERDGYRERLFLGQSPAAFVGSLQESQRTVQCTTRFVAVL